MQVSARRFAGFGSSEESMEDHAEEVTTQDGADEGLVSRRVEGGCFGCEEDELDYGAEGEENYRAAEKHVLLVVTYRLIDYTLWGPRSCGVAGAGG